MLVSFALLSIGAFVVVVVVLGEPLTIERVLVVALILAGLSVMKLSLLPRSEQ
jgi:multidrug transporter EmrE-like cation transporter